MEKNEALKEVGKGLIAFANLFTALSIVNVFVTKNYFNTVEFIALVYIFATLYFTGYRLIKKGDMQWTHISQLVSQ